MFSELEPAPGGPDPRTDRQIQGRQYHPQQDRSRGPGIYKGRPGRDARVWACVKAAEQHPGRPGERPRPTSTPAGSALYNEKDRGN